MIRALIACTLVIAGCAPTPPEQPATEPGVKPVRGGAAPIAAATLEPDAPDPLRAYVEKIRAKIRSNLVIPRKTPERAEAEFLIVQQPTGRISRVQLLASSGYKPFDQAAERAIRRSSPLPQAVPRELFRRELRMKFRP